MSTESGGVGSGDVLSKIHIVKVDAANNEIRLAGAVFKITKLADNTTFELTTDQQGEAHSELLEPGTYEIVEVTPPVGYLPDDTVHTVTVAADKATIQKIENELIKIDVDVEKVWVGPGADSVEVRLLADGVESGTATLNEAGSWKHTFSGLPKHNLETGAEIVYTIEELAIEGYGSMVSGSAGDGFVVTNINTTLIEVAVEKVWIGPGADSVEVNLLADGVVVAGATLNEAGSWKYTFAELPKYDRETGEEIVYTLEEVELEGYSSTVSGSAGDGFVVTNVNTAVVEVAVEKVWIGPGADSVEVNLLADGVVVAGATLNEAGSWKYTFAELPKYDRETGEEIVYTLEEVELEGYSSMVSGSAGEGFVVTNINTTLIEVAVEKVWIGPGAESAEVKLLADGVAVDTATLDEAGSWKRTFTELPKYDRETGKEIVYTIEEKEIEGYSSTVSGSATDGYVITNVNTAVVEVTVEKVWIGPGADSVEVNLLADGVVVAGATLNEAGSWKYTFAELPKYDRETGEEIVYTLEEVELEGYSSTISGSAADGFIVTNVNTTLIEVAVEKVWIGPGADSVEVNLLADGVVVAGATLNEAGSWKYTFAELPKYDLETGEEIVYALEEVEIEGYSSTVSGSAADGFVVTNVNTAVVEVAVEKVWIGSGADSAEVKLLADGVEVATAALNEAGSWKRTFTELPKYDRETGKEIVYTIEETEIEGYSSTISGSAAEGFVVTNVNDAVIDITVKKVWVGKQAGSVVMRLLADGKVLDTVTIKEADGWKHDFAGLRRYDAVSGREIIYTIEEKPLGGYRSVVSGSVAEGFVVTNTEIKTTVPPKTGESGVPFAGVLLLAVGAALLLLKRRFAKN